jgi:hypothetical protein
MRKLVLVPVLAFGACGWSTTRRYISPDETAEVRIYQPRGLRSSGLRIIPQEHGRETEIFSKRGDMFFHAAEVFWSGDGEVVGLFTCGEPFVRVAFDRKTLSHVSFSLVRDEIAKRLRRKYEIPAEERDEFEWTCQHAATTEFRRRFGDATRP